MSCGEADVGVEEPGETDGLLLDSECECLFGYFFPNRFSHRVKDDIRAYLVGLVGNVRRRVHQGRNQA